MAVDDPADERVGAAEELGGERDIAAAERPADARRGHRAVMFDQERHRLDGEAEPFAEGGKERHVALPPAAEREVLAGDEPLPTGEKIGSAFEAFLAGLDDQSKDNGDEPGWEER